MPSQPALYVVAWPVLATADEAALTRLRARYHPREAGLVGPHFTLVFGAAAENASVLQRRMEAVAAARRPFWFMFDRLRHERAFPDSRSVYLFAEPAEGAVELIDLHEAFNEADSERSFSPHVTLGVFSDAGAAEQVARIVERQHLPMHGRVEELALLRHDAERIDVVATCRLSG